MAESLGFHTTDNSGDFISVYWKNNKKSGN